MFQTGYFGPVSMNGTILFNISNENNLKSGNRIAQLQYVYNNTIKIQNPDFIVNLTKAEKDV